MRLLFTGSQLWTDKKQIFEELDLILEEVCMDADTPYELTLVHGDCPNGADAFADEWGNLRKSQGFPITIENHPADWKGPRKRGAGYARNAEMVKLKADRCVAFILDESPGSTHCSDLAKKAGIVTDIFRRTSNMATKPKRVTENLQIDNIRLLWPNFAGEKRKFNEGGKRNFNIAFEEEEAAAIKEMGWPIREWERENDEGEKEIVYLLKVTVKMDGQRPPVIYLVSTIPNGELRRTALDEEMVHLLDKLEFSEVHVNLRPYNYDVSGSKGVAAYLKTGVFILAQDDLERRYAHIPLDGDDIPLEIENIIDAEAEWVDDEETLMITAGD